MASPTTQCPYSRLRLLGDSVAGNTFVLPVPGTYEFVVAAGGTRMEPLGQGMSPGGEAWKLQTSKPGQMVSMRFDYAKRTFSAVDPESGASLLVEVSFYSSLGAQSGALSVEWFKELTG